MERQRAERSPNNSRLDALLDEGFGWKMGAMKVIVIIGGALVAVAAAWWALEMGLLKASRYRLAHGDGREHSFRRKDRAEAKN